VPLSEEELRMLEQMERALVEEDPKLASTLRGTSLRRTARRRAIAAGLAFAAGVAVLMAGVITAYWVVGVVGFVIMLLSATVAVTALRGQQAGSSTPQRTTGGGSHGFTVIHGGRSGRSGGRLRRSRGSSSSSHGSFMHRMEERWRRRRDQNGGGF
jgi:uncharacterized membrane protein YgcG